MEKLLLYVCCAPCAVYPIQKLRDRYDLALVFYGPNIHPEEEYKRRLDSAKEMSEKTGVRLIELERDTDKWFKETEGLKDEPEGGKRCNICYKTRLNRTAEYAAENGFSFFGGTLTTSPYKSAVVINSIGHDIAEKNGIVFLAEDFKKEDGFKKGCELSREFGLYRQKYCGCVYSLKRR